jgi:hypothetical protein
MNAWMRRSDMSLVEPWHLLLGISPHGMRVAHCGTAFAPDTDLLTVPFDDPPRPTEMCEACQVAARRMAPLNPAAQPSSV